MQCASAKILILVMVTDFSPTSAATTLNLLAQFTAPEQLQHAAFEARSLPCNTLTGYFHFVLTQNEPWFLDGSAHTTTPVDGLRTTKQIAHHNQRASLWTLITLCPDPCFHFHNPESYPYQRIRNLAEAPWCRWKSHLLSKAVDQATAPCRISHQ